MNFNWIFNTSLDNKNIGLVADLSVVKRCALNRIGIQIYQNDQTVFCNVIAHDRGYYNFSNSTIWQNAESITLNTLMSKNITWLPYHLKSSYCTVYFESDILMKNLILQSNDNIAALESSILNDINNLINVEFTKCNKSNLINITLKLMTLLSLSLYNLNVDELFKNKLIFTKYILRHN